MILGKEEQISTIKELMKYGSSLFIKRINTLVNELCKDRNLKAFELLPKEDIQLVFNLAFELL